MTYQIIFEYVITKYLYGHLYGVKNTAATKEFFTPYKHQYRQFAMFEHL